PGDRADRDRALPTDHDGELTGSQGAVDPLSHLLEVIRDEAEVLRPRVLQISTPPDLGKIAVVDHSCADLAQPVRKSGQAQERWRLLHPRPVPGSARRGTD